uniref:lysosomal amino acid transporter 1 homolog isoform X3 n=1 Tax=Pristiophorus japonicus TaxID=55135 RepID=UPI00398F68B8
MVATFYRGVNWAVVSESQVAHRPLPTTVSKPCRASATLRCTSWEILPSIVRTGPGSFGIFSKCAPKTAGTWQVLRWGYSPSSVSWCLLSHSTAINAIVVFMMIGVTVSLVPGNDFGSPIREMPRLGRRSLLAVHSSSGDQQFTTEEIIGFTIGSFSSVFYLASRLPQLYKNISRKSTEGISIFLFALMILGNLTYGLSVLVKVPKNGQSEGNYIVHHLPWLVGSLGTMALDAAILFQFFKYREQNAEERKPLVAAKGHRAVDQ